MFENSMLNDDRKVLIVGEKIVSYKETLKYGLPIWGKVSVTLFLNLNRPLLVQSGFYY